MTLLTIKKLLPLVYFLLVSFPHHFVSRLLDDYILVPFGMDVVQSYANLASYILIFLVGVLGVRALQLHGRKAIRHLLAWLLTIALMYAADRYQIVNNIERIHFPQYAVLAILLAVTLKDDVLIFFVTCLAGVFDEFQQYALKPSHTNSLDFNDFVLNILGAALGVLIVITLFRRDTAVLASYNRRFRLVFYRIVLGITFITGLAIGVGRVARYANVPKADRHVVDVVDGKWQFILSFQKDNTFWIVADNGKRFHVMTVFEGLIVVAALLVFYWWVIVWLRRKSEGNNMAGDRRI